MNNAEAFKIGFCTVHDPTRAPGQEVFKISWVESGHI